MIGLAIDTSTNVMGVGLANEEKVIAEMITNEKKNQSVRLMPAIERLLTEVDLNPIQLDRIVVANGPGSYTGLRIGVTVAKTLAWSLNIPLVGISSLEVLAHNGRYFKGLISPLIDARREQIYTGLYRFQDGQFETVERDCIVLSDEWATYVKKYEHPILFLGNDLNKHKDTLSKRLAKQAHFGVPTEHNPRPGELATLGLKRSPVENIHQFTPNYVQMAEAERNWLLNKNEDQI